MKMSVQYKIEFLIIKGLGSSMCSTSLLIQA
jgi:hypothetical protein